MKYLHYLRPLWEGADKKPSLRKVFAILFMAGVIRMIELSYKHACQLNDDVLVTLCGTILLLLGIITAQHILQKKNVNTENGQTNITED